MLRDRDLRDLSYATIVRNIPRVKSGMLRDGDHATVGYKTIHARGNILLLDGYDIYHGGLCSKKFKKLS